MVLEKIKVLLNISDTDSDTLLNTLIGLKSGKLQAALRTSTIPTSLEYIVIELVIQAYNKLGSEGLSAESVEGISRTYDTSMDELEPYKYIIAQNLNATHGKFRFI